MFAVFSRVFLESGFCEVPLLPTIKRDQQIICGFCKYTSQAEGPFGVIMYDIVRSSTVVCRIAIMFSVPFDRNLHENYIGLGIFEPSQACNAELLTKMYYNKTQDFFKREPANGGEISFEGKGYTIKGTMSQGLGAYMWVTVLNRSGVKDTKTCDSLFRCFTIKKIKNKKKQVSK